jgi:hypothetical protein
LIRIGLPMPDPSILQLGSFFIGVNDPLGLNPTGVPFSPSIFDLYRPWLGLFGRDDDAQYRQSIARGEEVFNTTNINITGVAGRNDVLKVASIPGFCGTCHDTPNIGNHSVKAPLNIGIANAGANSPPALDNARPGSVTIKVCSVGIVPTSASSRGPSCGDCRAGAPISTTDRPPPCWTS